LRTLRVPITQAAMRLMLASKKSSPNAIRFRASPPRTNLVGDGLGLVVQEHHVIAVPTHAAAELEEDVIHEAQGGRQLVGYDFGGVEVPGVQAQHESSGWPRTPGRTRWSRLV